MSAQTFSNLVIGTSTWQDFRLNYNNVASEMNSGVLRYNGPTVVGNVTLNGVATIPPPLEIVSTLTINNASYQQNTTNRLENRGGILFFNGKRVSQQLLAVPIYAYAAGGDDLAGAPLSSTSRLTFSTTTYAAYTPAALSAARESLAGLSDKTTYGYISGGRNSAGTQQVTTDRLTYSTGVAAARTGANLSVAAMPAGISDSTTYGYQVQRTTTSRFTFSTSTAASHTGTPILARDLGAAVSDPTTYGYYTGGNPVTANTERMTYSTGALAVYTQGNMSQVRYVLGSMNDQTTYGYFLGGSSVQGGPAVATADRLTYSTGATAAQTTANISGIRNVYNRAADDWGNGYGYISGGYQEGAIFNYVATTDRLTYSTSTTAAFTAANLPANIAYQATVTDNAV